MSSNPPASAAFEVHLDVDTSAYDEALDLIQFQTGKGMKPKPSPERTARLAQIKPQKWSDVQRRLRDGD